MKLIRQKLESFSIGSYVRMIQSKNEDSDNDSSVIYKMTSPNFGLEKDFTLTNDSGEYHYFMKDRKYGLIEGSFSPSFIKAMNYSIENPNGNTAYYEVDKIKIDNGSFIQYNDRCYFLKENSYENELPVDWSPYLINQQNMVDGKDINKLVSAYISTTYSKDYFDQSHIVENKTIPIYDLSKDVLSRISFVNLKSKDNVDVFINSIPALAANRNAISGVFFNSVENEFNSSDYDSISIHNLLNVTVSNRIKVDYTKLFNNLFAILPYESFLRMFNKKGEIRLTSGVDLNRYMYSFSLSTKDILKEAPMNYYSLKVLKNPEIYHDYSLSNIYVNDPVAPPHYDRKYNAVHDIIRIYRKCICSRLNDWESENDIIKNADSHFSNESFISSFITDTVLNLYPLYSYDMIKNRIDEVKNDGLSPLDDSFLNKNYRNHFLRKYGIDIRNSTLLATYNNLKKELENATLDFYVKAKNYIDKNYLGENESMIRMQIYEFIHDVIDEFITNKPDNKAVSTAEFNLIMDKLTTMSVSRNSSLIDNFIENKRFEYGIYKLSLKDILTKAGLEDMNAFNDIQININNEAYAGVSSFIYEHPIRMNAKIDDYMSVYHTMFDHENEFSVSGVIYGSRSYDKCYKSCDNSLELMYNYKTTFDERFLKSMLGSQKQVAHYDETEGAEFDASFTADDIISIVNSQTTISIFNERQMIDICTVLLGDSSAAEQKVKDCEAFEFTHQMENSSSEAVSYSLAPRKIADDEYVLVSTSENEANWIMRYFEFLDNMSKFQYVEKFAGEHYYKNMTRHKSNIFSLEVKNSGLSEESSDSKETKEIKQAVRNSFEEAIRKSIHRYAPAETTLWKIDFID